MIVDVVRESRFVVTRVLSAHPGSWSRPAGASLSLLLRSLQDPDQTVGLDAFASEGAAGAAGGEVYEVLFVVEGPWERPPSHAVHAIWEVRDLARAAAFIESRRELFTLRRRVLPTFAADCLLKHRGRDGCYMVVGFYGDEEGAARLCREHPEIKSFAAAHPAGDYTATDLTGPRAWRIEASSRVAEAG